MKSYPTVSCHLGAYDLCHPKERQMHYSLCLPDDAPKDLIRDFTLGEDDPATDDPIEAAQLAVDRAENLWVCTNKPRYSNLLAWLRENRWIHNYERLLAKKGELQSQLADVEDQLAEYPEEPNQ